jgi:putative two-component system response regulator
MSKVLIVDDEIMITQTLSNLIELMLDVTVMTFNDPVELLQSDVLDTTEFDLIISDFMMPRLNGIGLLKGIKEKQPDMVSILLTGYSDKENAIKSINEVGLYYYLEKPWDNGEIIKVIQNGLEKRRLEHQVKMDFNKIQERNHEINRLYDLLKRDFNQEVDNMVHVVVALANMIEAKDSYTEGHTRRVADLCRTLGEGLGVAEDDLRFLEISAIIHDIGKIGTPEIILNKPASLSDTEFEIMRNHPEIGARILRPLSSLEPCIDAVLHHHEKLDGSGYPHGLRAENIPLTTRIVAVADIFDALYSDRPYRVKMPLERAMSIIEKDTERGKLDPTVVAYLKQLVDNGTITRLYDED